MVPHRSHPNSHSNFEAPFFDLEMQNPFDMHYAFPLFFQIYSELATEKPLSISFPNSVFNLTSNLTSVRLLNVTKVGKLSLRQSSIWQTYYYILFN